MLLKVAIFESACLTCNSKFFLLSAKCFIHITRRYN